MKMLTYQEWKRIRSEDWKTEPISCTCKVAIEREYPLRFCDAPTVAAYPTMGGGWQSLCDEHAKKHPEAFRTDELIRDGETWD